MKISRNWLNNYITSNRTDDELVDDFTQLGLECTSSKLNSIDSNIVIGKNTINAVRSGFFWGYTGLIDNIVELIKKESKKKFKIIITGGFSKLFVNSLKSKVIIDKDITIKGLIRTVKLINF